jgi:hypothetical protein
MSWLTRLSSLFKRKQTDTHPDDHGWQTAFEGPKNKVKSNNDYRENGESKVVKNLKMADSALEENPSAPLASIQLNLDKKAEYEAACRKCEEGHSKGFYGGRKHKQRTRRVIRRQKRQTKRKNRS